MIRVAVSGAAGRMGSLTCTTVEEAEDMELVARFDPVAEDTADPDAVAAADVVVEFTRPDVVMDNLARWRHQEVHAVVGTSGFIAERLRQLEQLWGEGPPNCLVVPNFSIGAVLMMRFAELAAPHFAGAEVIERHHADKPDAPSGTSASTAERIAAAGLTGETAYSEEIVAGARGADIGGVKVHSLRLTGSLAHQEVVFGGNDETLVIRHDTSGYTSFMPGVLLAVRQVASLAGGVTVGLEGLLGI